MSFIQISWLIGKFVFKLGVIVAKKTLAIGDFHSVPAGQVATRLHFCGGHRLERLLDKLALQILGFLGGWIVSPRLGEME